MAYGEGANWEGGGDSGHEYPGGFDFPAVGSLGASEEDDLAFCVPDQAGWAYGRRAAANGMADFAVEAVGVAAAGRVGFAPLPAAAAETRSKRLQHVDELEQLQQLRERGRSVGQPGFTVSVTLMYQRDEDILTALLERETAANRGAVTSAVGAVGLRSFAPAHQRMEQQQVQQLLLGRVVLGVDLQLPRDTDLLQQLVARAGVTAGVLARMGQGSGAEASVASSMGVAAVGVEQVRDRIVALPAEEREQFLEWQGHEGSLVYFTNASFAEGAGLRTADDRCFLPLMFLLDSGCQPAIMDAKYGISMGLRAVDLSEPRYLMKADGKLVKVSKVFENVEVVLKKGTADEMSMFFNFISMPEAEGLYQVAYGALADHQAGGMGVDRVDQVYRYRPRYASHGDKHTVAEIPVKCFKAPAQAHQAAAVVAWREVSAEEWEAELAAGEQQVKVLVRDIFAAVMAQQQQDGVSGVGVSWYLEQLRVGAERNALLKNSLSDMEPPYLYSLGKQAVEEELEGDSSPAGDKGQVRLPLLHQQQQQPLGQLDKEEDWWDARSVWEEEDAVGCVGEDFWGEEVTGVPVEGVGCSLGFCFFAGSLLQMWGLAMWAYSWVVFAAFYPTTLLAMLHTGMANHCWAGWKHVSRQQSRQWRRGRQRNRAAFKGWSPRQWFRTLLLSLALLIGWCFCSVRGMDPYGTELSLLVTAGIAVLNVRHLGGAAPSFRAP
jgi:hypothetical protein